ncbi:MAG: hypothetical protein HQL26_01990 [Candidatus Omnitrophica bacterium]|nr:hypothetical protein [Candidatus Omnitrophota bacterium]
MKKGQKRFLIMVCFGILGAAGLILYAVTAQARLKDIKMYREAFPDAKVKCLDCHMDEKPSKDDGKHELNDYGKAVIKENPDPTGETFKKIGKIEDFKPAKTEEKK